MLNFLTEIYLNSNRKENARFEFKKLIIKNENYYSFLTKFLYLLNKIKMPKKSLKKVLKPFKCTASNPYYYKLYLNK
jgi:hypothetical protein